MGSWVLHGAGLSVEELSRNQVQLLGLGCRPSEQKVNPGAPPPQTVVDGSGEWWELGDRARQGDSASRLDKRGRHAAAPTDTSKFHLCVADTGSEAGARTLLLPDYVEAQVRVDDPKAICSSERPPGLPLQSKANTVHSGSGGMAGAARRGTAQFQRGVSETRSRIEMRVTDAHHSVVQRRIRMGGSEYFSLMVPCCRIFLGRESQDEFPRVDPKEYPAFIQAAVLGGRVDGEVVNRPKTTVADGKKKAKTSKSSERVKWKTSTGEHMVLNFHNGPTSKGPKGHNLVVSDLLAHLDEQWVKRARLYPSTWSVLWVETLDTQMVLSELNGEGITPNCPFCYTKLVFGAVSDKDEESDGSSSDDERRSNCSMLSSRSVSSTGSVDLFRSEDATTLAKAIKVQTASRRTENELKKRQSVKAVKKLIFNSSFLAPDMSATGVFMSTSGSNTESRRGDGSSVRSGSQSGIQSTIHSGMQSVEVSRTPTMESLSAASADLGRMSFLVGGEHQALSESRQSAALSRHLPGAKGAQRHIDHWQAGKLHCQRCCNERHSAKHALICPKLDKRHTFFKPLCAECRGGLECMFEMPRANAEEGDDEDETEPPPPSLVTAMRPAFAVDSGVLTAGKDQCVAIEIELSLQLRADHVHDSRHQLLLDELRDELHRALQVPLRQIFVLQDNTSKTGMFQIGILHPALVPTQVQRKRRQRELGFQNGIIEADELLKDDSEVDLEVLDAGEDLAQMWDRLVLFLYDSTALHRKKISNAFPLLRSRRRSVASLQWKSATVVPLENGSRLIENLLDGEGQDDFVDVADSDDDDEYGLLADGSIDNEDLMQRPSGSKPRSLTQDSFSEEKRRLSKIPLPMGPSDSLRTHSLESSPSNEKKVNTLSSLNMSRQVSGESSQVQSSRLRPPDLADMLGTLPEVSTDTMKVKVEHTWQRRSEAHYWKQDATDLCLLPPLSEVDAIHMPPLHHITWSRNLSDLMIALQTADTASLNAVDRMRRTPLHLAVARCSVDHVSLFTCVAEPNGPVSLEMHDENGRAPIHYAAFRGDVAIMNCFIQILQPASLDLQDTVTGDCAALVASRYMHEDVLRSLLTAGASANVANLRGLSPLHVAAAAGSITCCELLLKARASQESRDALGRCPLDWARIYRNADIASLLQQSRPEQSALQELSDRNDRSLIGLAVASTDNDKAVAALLDMASVSVGPPTPKAAARRHQARPPAKPRPAAKSGKAMRPRPMQEDRPDTAPEVKIAAAEAPVTGKRREMLLDGRRVSKETLVKLGVDGWTGHTGSLAVRWRNWAQNTFPDRSRTKLRQRDSESLELTSGRQASPQLESRPSSQQQEGVSQVSDDPTRDQVAATAEAMGGFFCTTCWEYVLDGHPRH